MAVLLTHRDVTFENQTVYLTGHSYVDCRFVHCTLVLRDGPEAAFENCRFESCVWHLDLVVPNFEACTRLEHLIGSYVKPTLVREAPIIARRPPNSVN
jgi:hypothetical protein